MNTIFTVTCTKGDGLEYTIDLGQDILEGKSDSMIRMKAEQSYKIDEQGPLRKLSGADAITEHLVKRGFPNVTVTEGVKREPSVNAEVKALIAILGEDKVREMLEEAKAKKAAEVA